MSQKEAVKYSILKSLSVIRMYDWLLDLYVLDYFVDDHWLKLPQSWQKSFIDMDPQQLGNILSGQLSNHVYPLSFLALIKTVSMLSIPRKSSVGSIKDLNQISVEYTRVIEKDNENNLKSKSIQSEKEHIQDDKILNLQTSMITESVSFRNIDNLGNHPKLKNLFLKHVKSKKRHEISVMAGLVHKVAVQRDCKAVIDFGSGLGHLVRMLAYKYDLYAAGIECQSQLTETARKLDKELEYTASKHISAAAMSKLRRPHHFNVTLSSLSQLTTIPLPPFMLTYGLIGLHPCGDLGPLLLRHFVNFSHVKFICVVGCCYMKLTCDLNCGYMIKGYPMSNFVAKLDSHLSYPSREIACHAIEVYCDRLRKGDYEDLKVHAYRAAFEKILIEYNAKLKHTQIRSIKHSNNMSFERYCSLALERLDIPFPECAEMWRRGMVHVQQWRRVVTVYTLRLALAPLVETVILLDRMMYLIENGLSCEIHPVFDPRLSPRNHVIIARR